MLTPKQQRTYQFICEHIATYGHAPSLEEISIALGVRSRTSAFNHVRALTEQGLIRLSEGRKRNIELVEPPSTNTCLPLAGKIAAGQPIEAIEQQDYIDMAQFFVGPERFVLKITGDSMIDAGILDSDLVIIQRQNTARDGDIVVALIDGEEATLKYLQKNTNNTITLLPANTTLQPMIYSAERIAIQGVVVGQMRSYD